MNLWKSITDPFGTLSKANDIGTNNFHAATGIPTAESKRAAASQIENQVKAYKEQSELARQEIDTKRGEIAAEKRRVNEKQIRSLRRSHSVNGFLGSAQTEQPGMSDKLGG